MYDIKIIPADPYVPSSPPSSPRKSSKMSFLARPRSLTRSRRMRSSSSGFHENEDEIRQRVEDNRRRSRSRGRSKSKSRRSFSGRGSNSGRKSSHHQRPSLDPQTIDTLLGEVQKHRSVNSPKSSESATKKTDDNTDANSKSTKKTDDATDANSKSTKRSLGSRNSKSTNRSQVSRRLKTIRKKKKKGPRNNNEKPKKLRIRTKRGSKSKFLQNIEFMDASPVHAVGPTTGYFTSFGDDDESFASHSTYGDNKGMTLFETLGYIAKGNGGGDDDSYEFSSSCGDDQDYFSCDEDKIEDDEDYDTEDLKPTIDEDYDTEDYGYVTEDLMPTSIARAFVGKLGEKLLWARAPSEHIQDEGTLDEGRNDEIDRQMPEEEKPEDKTNREEIPESHQEMPEEEEFEREPATERETEENHTTSFVEKIGTTLFWGDAKDEGRDDTAKEEKPPSHREIAEVKKPEEEEREPVAKRETKKNHSRSLVSRIGASLMWDGAKDEGRDNDSVEEEEDPLSHLENPEEAKPEEEQLESEPTTKNESEESHVRTLFGNIWALDDNGKNDKCGEDEMTDENPMSHQQMPEEEKSEEEKLEREPNSNKEAEEGFVRALAAKIWTPDDNGTHDECSEDDATKESPMKHPEIPEEEKPAKEALEEEQEEPVESKTEEKLDRKPTIKKEKRSKSLVGKIGKTLMRTGAKINKAKLSRRQEMPEKEKLDVEPTIKKEMNENVTEKEEKVTKTRENAERDEVEEIVETEIEESIENDIVDISADEVTSAEEKMKEASIEGKSEESSIEEKSEYTSEAEETEETLGAVVAGCIGQLIGNPLGLPLTDERLERLPLDGLIERLPLGDELTETQTEIPDDLEVDPSFESYEKLDDDADHEIDEFEKNDDDDVITDDIDADREIKEVEEQSSSEQSSSEQSSTENNDDDNVIRDDIESEASSYAVHARTATPEKTEPRAQPSSPRDPEPLWIRNNDKRNTLAWSRCAARTRSWPKAFPIPRKDSEELRQKNIEEPRQKQVSQQKSNEESWFPACGEVFVF